MPKEQTLHIGILSAMPEEIGNLIKETEMGQIKKIVSTFGFKLKKIRKDSRLFSKKLGGGSILDLGCYPVSFFNLFKKDKQMKVIRSKFNLCETDVDING